MTLRDLMEQIEIQGGVIIRRFEDDGETEISILDTTDFECDRYKLQDNDLDRRVIYLYPVVMDMAYLGIEVE